MQSYALPLFGAVLFHVLVAAFVIQGFESQDDIAEVVTPKVVNAKLLVIEPPKKVTPVPAKQPIVKRAEPPAPKPRPTPKEVKQDTVNSEDAAAKAAQAERQRKEREAQRRQERLGLVQVPHERQRVRVVPVPGLERVLVEVHARDDVVAGALQALAHSATPTAEVHCATARRGLPLSLPVADQGGLMSMV